MKVTIEIDGTEHTVELPPAVEIALKQIATRNGLSFETALEQAITNENFLDDQQANGKKLLIEKNGKLRELVREPEPA